MQLPAQRPLYITSDHIGAPAFQGLACSLRGQPKKACSAQYLTSQFKLFPLRDASQRKLDSCLKWTRLGLAK